MIEILGSDLDQAFIELGINATKTYQCENKWWEYQENYQVWEMSEEEFEKLDSIKEDRWNDEWGWWRYAQGSVMSGEWHRYNVNNHYLIAWDGTSREKYDWMDRKYKCLLEYYCEEHGLSQPKNICALSVDLARMNNMKMSELWQKYMG